MSAGLRHLDAAATRLVDVAGAALVLLILLPVLPVLLLRLAAGELRWQHVVVVGRAGRPVELGRLTGPDGHGAAFTWTLLLSLVDVLRGHLALVGPRPLAPAEAAAVGDRHPRFLLRPGLVNLHALRQRANIAFEPEPVVDREYAARRHVGRDLAILFRWLLLCGYGDSSEAPAPRRLSLLRVRIDNVAMTDALTLIDDAIARRQSLGVAFVNADCLNKAVTDTAYRRALSAMSLVLPDGIGVKLGASWLGYRIRENVNGTDVFPRLCARLAASGRRLFLYGAAPGVAADVAAWVRRHHPGLVVCGVRDGYGVDLDADVDAIRQAAPDVLLVALGAPRQEEFIAHHAAAAGVPVAIGVGGLFDFYSGRIPRAPLWMRELALEWSYRLWQEPRRMWRRYLVGNLLFVGRVLLVRRAATKGVPLEAGA